MRVFLMVLSAGFALAAPQGYNYQIGVGNNVQAIPNQYQQFVQQYSPQVQTSFGKQLLQNTQQSIQYEQQQQQQQQQLQTVQQQVKTPAFVVEPPQEEVAGIVEHASPQELVDPQPQFIIKSRVRQQPEAVFQQTAPVQKKVTFQKEFYYLSAPQEEYETPKELDDQLAAIKKNLRVVFIKAPENNGLENAALQLAKQSANSQTAIYVLTKQHDAADLANKLQSIKSTPQRPEVSFIKYRTPEEAEHAQRVIQAQYEALDGPNHINRPDTGVTHSFVGATGSGDPRKSSGAGENAESSKPNSQYLPALAKL